MYTEQSRGKSILAKQAASDQLSSWGGSYRNLGNKPSIYIHPFPSFQLSEEEVLK